MDTTTFAELDFSAWLTVAVVVAVFGLLLWERMSPALVLLGAVIVLTAGGVLTPVEAAAGFGNTAVLTVAVLFVVTGALRSTGAIRWVASWVLGKPHGTFVAQTRLIGISASMSAFINNTPVVAMLTAAVEQWSRHAKVPASRLLIPLSYATILGGMCTLIGTSTNLIVLGLMQQEGDLPLLKMFDPAMVGIPVLLGGVLYLLAAGRLLLPDRSTALDQARRTEEYVLEMFVMPDGVLDGVRMGDSGLRDLSDAFLIELRRAGEVMLAVGPDTRLHGDDRVVFVGTASGLGELRQVNGLTHADSRVFDVSAGDDRHFVEVVLSRLSPAVGHTLRGVAFRKRYDAVVVAINRRGRQLSRKPDNVVLQAGDTLLLEATPGFVRRHEHSREFLMVNLIDGTPSVQPRKALAAITIILAMVALNVAFHVDIFLSALLAAAAVVVSRCIDWRTSLRVIDYPLVITIACALALGLALAKTGVAAAVASGLLALGTGSPMITLALVYVLTVVFTELLTNNAAAVLMFPIGVAAATQLGASAMPFIMTVMIGASASFITPIGYQTNMMVYGPGGYRFIDYVRVGTPLSVIVGIIALAIIPAVWPF